MKKLLLAMMTIVSSNVGAYYGGDCESFTNSTRAEKEIVMAEIRGYFTGKFDGDVGAIDKGVSDVYMMCLEVPVMNYMDVSRAVYRISTKGFQEHLEGER